MDDKAAFSIIAFDFGTSRIGVASGQTLTASATPLPSIRHGRRRPDWRAIEDLVKRWQPEVLLVGLPLNMDGSESEICALARGFADELAARCERRVELVDERLSTREAHERMEHLGRGDIDSLSAQVIAETWLTPLNQSRYP